MNRENKKMKYEKGYYKTHPCTDSFTCRNCGRLVVSAGAGSSHRGTTAPTAWPACTWTWSRATARANAAGLMEPVAVWVRKNGEWAIIHRCRICGAMSSNRVAADDNPMMLMSISQCAPWGGPRSRSSALKSSQTSWPVTAA